MTYFYRLMLWCLRHEIVIARSTGRNPLDIARLSSEIQEYELLILKHELNAVQYGEKGFEVNDQDRYEFECQREQWEAEQAALEPHQRDGYTENMVCMNEEKLKALRENGL